MIFRMGITMALFLLVFPFCLGAAWSLGFKKGKIIAAVPVGYFIETAVFHFLEMPFAFLELSFSVLCWVYFSTLIILSFLSLVVIRKKIRNGIKFEKTIGKLEMVYGLFALALVSFQVYNNFIRDTTYWSYDDAEYLTAAADAVRYDSIQKISPNTGVAQLFNSHRGLQSSLYFPGVLSFFSGLLVPIIARTVLSAYYVILAYLVYYYMATCVFSERENRFIFIILLSVLHIYGYYSPYSITFRILGPNYQGKAILAAILFPLLFTMFIEKMEENYNRKFAFLLLVFSASAVGLTMFGALTMILNVCIVCVLGMLKRKRIVNTLKYIPWGISLPLIYSGVYLVYRYVTW